MHRRSVWMLLFSFWTVDVGVLVALVSLFMGSPGITLAGLSWALMGLSWTGLFPADRDLPDKETVARWTRVMSIIPPAVIFGNFAMLAIAPQRFETAGVAAILAMQFSLMVVFSRAGKLLTQEEFERQLAAGDCDARTAEVLKHRPGRGGRALRRAIAGSSAAIIVVLGVLAGLIVWRSDGAVPPFRWGEVPVHYCIDDSEGYMDRETVDEYVAWAFETWGVPAESLGTCAGPVTHGDGVSAIGWREIDREGTRPAGTTNRERDMCQFFCRASERHGIVEADILLDPTPDPETDYEYCFDHLVLHEVGHFLGLPHMEEPGVMSVNNECEYELSDADQAALYSRYGGALQRWAKEATR